MAALAPFRALRPAPAAAARVAAVPYDVVNADEARALADGNPLSFLHVSRAEIDCARDVNPYSDTVYAKAVANLEQLKRDAPLLVEDAARIYVYRLRMGEVTQSGIAACFSLDEYDHDVIKKHERTRPDKEDDRTRHLLALRTQTGPVFLIHREAPAIDRVVERVVASETPLYDFTAPDAVQHTVWRVDARDERPLIEAFAAIPTLYIADGHHRAASAARARQQLRGGGAGTAGEWDTFLAVAFPATQVRILPYNRVVTDLAGRTPATFLDALRQRFTVQDGPVAPARRGEVSMFLAGKWHTIALGEASAAAPATDRLDVSRLQDVILNPLLGIGDPRSSTRIDFVGGLRGTGELEHAVQSGRAAVAFSLFPVGVQDLMTIADAGGIMPPKSTWFEPKLRDGLLSHLIGVR
jgi:uncharacterized protein (DUF1015 family)